MIPYGSAIPDPVYSCLILQRAEKNDANRACLYYTEITHRPDRYLHMHDNQKKIAAQLAAIMPGEAVRTTSLKGLTLFRIDHSFSRTPYAYNSEIVILGQGVKHT